MTPAEMLRKKLQDALDDVDGEITVAEALSEVVFLLASFTVAENVDEIDVTNLYLDTCRKFRVALGGDATPADG